MSRAELAKYSVSLHSWIVDVRNKSTLIRAIQSAIDAYITEYENTKNPFSSSDAVDLAAAEISWANTIKKAYSAVVGQISSNTSQFFQDVPKITDEQAQSFNPIHFLLTLDDRDGSWSVGMVRSALKVRILAAISDEYVASFCSKKLGFVEGGDGFVDASIITEDGSDDEEQVASFDDEAIRLVQKDIINLLKKSDHALMIYKNLLVNFMQDSRHARQRVDRVDVATSTKDLRSSADVTTSTEDLLQPPAKSVAARR